MRKSLRQLATILGYIWQSSPRLTLLNCVLALFRGALPLVLLFLVKLLVDEVSLLTQLPAHERSFDALAWILGVAGIVFLLNAISASTSLLARERHSRVLSDFFDNLVHDKSTRVKFEYLEHPRYQNVFYRALNEVTYRPARVYVSMLGIAQNAVTIFLMTWVMVMVHWGVSLLLVAITLPIVFIRLRYARHLFALKRENTRLERKAGYYNRMLTAPDFAKELRVFDLGNIFRQRYGAYKSAWRDSQYRLLVNKTRYETLVQVLAAIAFIAIYTLVAYKAFNGAISIGSVVLYFLAMQRGYAYLQELLGRLTALHEDSVFLDNLFDFLTLEELNQVNTPGQFTPFPHPLVNGVSFRGVGFRYPSNNRWVLRDVSFDVRAGETVAIVGSNGSGKSTLVKLLCSLYPPSEGTIVVDGISLGSFAPSDKNRNISAVFQDFLLYNVTARENIWFGNAGEPVDDNMVVDAACRAGIDTEIRQFEKGYETVIGTMFENSEPMSPGQWQRLAIARAIYNNAQILILDEPTSALDAFAEAKLLSYIRSVTMGRTSIIISHRLSTIRMANKIVVLDNARVCQVGTYEELAKQTDGKFCQMINSLSEFYE